MKDQKRHKEDGKRTPSLRSETGRKLIQSPGSQGKIKEKTHDELVHELRVHQIELETQNEELRRAQEELEASRKKYFDHYDLAPVGYITLNEEGMILEANLTAAALLGRNRSDIAGQPLSRLIFREDQDTYYFHCKQLFGTQSRQECRVRMMKGDGILFWALLESVIVRGKDEEPESRTTFRDITEITNMELALKSSEGKYSTLIENIPDRIFLKDGNSVYISCNDPFAHDQKTVASEIAGKTDYDFFPKADAEKYRADDKRIMETGEKEEIEESYILNGSEHWAHTVKTPVRDNDGNIVAVLGIFRDITERRRMEYALRESKERYYTLFEQSPDGVLLLDTMGKVIEFNETACRQLGYSREEFEKLSLSDIDVVSTPEELKATIKKVLEVGLSRFERKHKTKQGELREVSVVVKDISLSGRHFFQAIWRDITESKRQEEAIIQLNTTLESRVIERTAELKTTIDKLHKEMENRKEAEESVKLRQKQLEELNKTLEQKVIKEVAENREKDQLLIQQSRQAAMGEMIGNIAHQWRQPLNTLGLIIQDLLSAQKHGELDGAYLNTSVQEGMEVINHMSGTIDDFRSFFNPNKEKELFVVREILGKAVSFMEASFKNNNIAIRFEVQDDGAILGYANEYSQVLINILNNAKDVLLERKIADPYVAMRLSREEERSVVTITDNAGGIPVEMLDRVFDPYFTTKEQGKGTGIGLYMSKTIIEKNMQGRLSVRNSGQGAEFRIEV